MNKKISIGAAIAYMAIAAAITLTLTVNYNRNLFNDMLLNIGERENNYEKLTEIERYVRANFYGTIDEDQINASAAAGYIDGLRDPNARYLSPREYETYTHEEEGRYTGVGLDTELNEEGYLRVTRVYPESPAALVGIRAGDVITVVDHTTVTAENYTTLMALFQGDIGTKVTVVCRQGNEEHTLEMTRRDIEIPTVEARMIGSNGYLLFSSITPFTASQLERGLRTFTDSAAEAYIFDLRGIRSGTVKNVTDMLGLILPKGDIAYAVSRNGTVTTLATSDEKHLEGQLIVLTDEATTGPAELFAQVIKESGGKAVGATTRGQGSMQEVFRLKDGSAIVITTACYAGPRKSIYHGVGVTPDYEIRVNSSDPSFEKGNPDNDGVLRRALDVITTLQRNTVTQ